MQRAMISALFVVCGCSDLANAELGVDAGVLPSDQPAELVSISVGGGAGGGEAFTLAPTVGGYQSFGATTSIGTDGSVSFWNGVWNVPLPIDCGRAIGTLTVPVRDNGTANGHASDPNVVTAAIVLRSSTTEQTLASAVSDGSGTQQTLTIAAPTHTMVAGESLVLRLVPTTKTTPPHFALFPSLVGMMQVAYAPPMRTKIIAPNPTGIPSYTVIDVVGSGVGNATQNLDAYLSVGDHIRAIRLFVQDNTQSGGAVGYNGPTKLVSSLKSYSPSTGAVPTTIATSNVSNGSGTLQQLSMTGLDIPVAAGGAQHSLQTIDFIGVAPAVVWSIEIDYSAAP